MLDVWLGGVYWNIVWSDGSNSDKEGWKRVVLRQLKYTTFLGAVPNILIYLFPVYICSNF